MSANTAFIGKDALTHVAEQVGKNIIMGPAYSDPELLDRLGIQVISGIQYKKTDTFLVRKGGTTRRKVVGTPVANSIGFLKERTLVAKLTWNRYKDNIDSYVETPFGTDGKAGGEYPLSTVAVEAILASYAEDLTSNLFFGDMSLENDSDPDKAKLSLYDGFHTLIRKDMESGVINTANGNIVECDAITAPSNAHDSTPYDTVYDWYMRWSPRLRQQKKIILHCDLSRGSYIAQGYSNKFHGNVKVNYLLGADGNPNGSFTIPEMPRVVFTPSDAWGVGTRLMATVPNNLQYGVDSLSNESFVKVQFGSDDDAQDVIFQIQSIQGARLLNPLSYAFVISDGTIQNPLTPNVVNGDFTNSRLVINIDKAGYGTVKVNNVAYTEPQEFKAGEILTIAATAAEGKHFVSWSTGQTDATITVEATGVPMGLTAFFEND